jgi:lipoprotein-releasing system permease protein
MINENNLKIAMAHLTTRLKQALIAILSVTFGISMYIFMNSFMNGVNNIQTELAFSTLAHIRIYSDLPKHSTNFISSAADSETLVNLRNPKIIQYTEGIRNSQEIVDLLEKETSITAIAPQLNIKVFFRNGVTDVNGTLSGIYTDNENRLFETAQYIVEGSWNALDIRNAGIIIGVGLAQKLSLGLNDNLQVLTGEGITKNYRVLGIFETTLSNVDDTKAYIKINAARQLLSKNRDYVTDIQVNIDDYDNAPLIANLLEKKLKYTVEPWQVANGQLDAANALRNIIAIAVSLTILLVAGFGIYNIMNMTVNEKIREIAILKAIGFNGKDVVQIFLTQSIIVGIIGGIVGIVFGYVISIAVNNVPFEIATLKTLPIDYDISYYILAFVFGLITTFIAGYLPAKKASKIDPVEIIRSQ